MTLDRRKFLATSAAWTFGVGFSDASSASSSVPTVFAHGGGIVRSAENGELRRLAQSGDIYLSPYSATDWQENFRLEKFYFNSDGFSRIKLLSIASLDEFRAGVRAASVVWFCGGLQSLHMQSLASLQGATAILRQAYADGTVMAGGSAGAAVMSKLMISGGSNGNVYTRAGLGFLPNVVLDQHVVRRHREYRLQKVIAANPKLVGIGIDEETSVTFQGESVKVVGKGPVIVTYHQGGRLAEQRYKSGDVFKVSALQV